MRLSGQVGTRPEAGMSERGPPGAEQVGRRGRKRRTLRDLCRLEPGLSFASQEQSGLAHLRAVLSLRVAPCVPCGDTEGTRQGGFLPPLCLWSKLCVPLRSQQTLHPSCRGRVAPNFDQ